MATDKAIEAATLAMMRFVNAPRTAETQARTRALAVVALHAAEQVDARNLVLHRSAGRRIENAKEAFWRRFGKLLSPLAVTRFTADDGRECVQITHVATNTWAQYTICTRRVRRLCEHVEQCAKSAQQGDAIVPQDQRPPS